MSAIGVWSCLVGAALAVMNAVTTRRLWRSAAFDRSQKVAQTALVWLVPGGFVVVGSVLNEGRPMPMRDTTVHEAPELDHTLIEASHHHDSGRH